jgi:hypothetical protein
MENAKHSRSIAPVACRITLAQSPALSFRQLLFHGLGYSFRRKHRRPELIC